MRSEPPATPTVIVGAGLGGLSTAIHLRLAGHDVTIHEANDHVGGRAGRIVHDGFTFDIGPSLLNYPWVFEQLFAAAGRRFDDYVTLLPVDPSVAFQWPDGTRLALSSDLRRLLAELERIEPGCRPRALAFFQDASRKYDLAFNRLVTRNEDNHAKWIRGLGLTELAGLGLGRTLDGELGRFFQSPRIRQALGSYGMYLGGSPFDLPGLFSILPYGELAYGLWLPRGGVYGLVSGIERLARELGVVIHTSSKVRRILTGQGRVSGIELEGGTRQPARIVVSNVDVPTTDTSLVECEATVKAGLTRRAAATRMTPSVMTFYWGLRGPIDGIGHHTIFLPRDVRGTFDDLFKKRQVPGELAFYVSVPSATDPALAPRGCTAMFVLVPMPLVSDMPGADWPAVRLDIRRRVLERLRVHGVEIAEDRWQFEAVYSPVDWQRRFGLYDGSAFGAAHTLFQLGPWRARNYSREIAGLYYAGAGTTPGTGMPMVVLGGKMTADRITEQARQRAAS
ncbi:MAG: phytoene desaturase family protein [Vicinamibacterales bacterium]